MRRNKKQRAKNGKLTKVNNPTGMLPADKEHEIRVLRLKLAIAVTSLAAACAKVGAVALPLLSHLS